MKKIPLNLERIASRAVVRFPTEIKDFGKCVLIDISTSGAKIQTPTKIPYSLELLVSVIPDIPPMIIKARTVWNENGFAGIRFSYLEKKEFLIIDSLVKIHR